MDRNATVELHYRQHYKKLVDRFVNRVPNKSRAVAEEVVQEAYANALRCWSAFNPAKGDFGIWFNNCIIRNAFNTVVRPERGHILPSMDDEEEHLEPFRIKDDDYVPRDVAAKILNAIKNERKDVSEVLNMFFVLGMTTPDIEKCTRFSNAAIRKMIQRWRMKWDDENVF